eukprot:scaffold15131_cov64-Skeletonema_dohrnii-CCMP3373.AAC.2
MKRKLTHSTLQVSLLGKHFRRVCRGNVSLEALISRPSKRVLWTAQKYRPRAAIFASFQQLSTLKSVIITRRSSNIATTVAAAEIDQVNHRNIDRDLANRYYGILCRSYCPWIHQKRPLGRSITPVRWPTPAEHRRR